ncbi:hypothetical protein QYE77_11650 [Thermanaerothrix sp. 4228-RoL]|uniref:Uncharacterized protein n=1 Tax=Thermanaerothrix solaris TaxID=3058434 RepID=A0ABU3NQ07_9CHLR|nr:hypothetical protein [Thermanaerothrix sp. 4228-RoL]MDT8898918.1 hypothetical protein [Thermanaerothrix sp. 4228-RoL]
MKKQTFWLILMLLMTIGLGACASGNANASAPSTASSNVARRGTPQPFNFANLPLESKLAIGILKLEETNLAITPDQARTLLPFWKAVKTLSTSATTSPDELNAVYRQIEEALTTEQRNYIQTLQMTQEDLQNLMDSLGIQSTFEGGNGNFANLSESERATRIAQFQAQRSAGGGEPVGPGAPGGEFGFGPPANATTTTQRTPNPTQAAMRRNFGLNRLFLDPLIQMLEKKASG